MKKGFILFACVLVVVGFAGCGPKKVESGAGAEGGSAADIKMDQVEEYDVSGGGGPYGGQASAEDVAEARNTIEDLYFDYDRYAVRADARSVLEKNAEILNKTGTRVTIEGHCDERGSTEYNIALGERRAKAAKDYLVNLGVSASRVTTISYGEEKPFCSESNEDCWQKNRRAHFDVK
ncbi:MAG: peptidoglycan-associated lipoprotein Pal [Thermodesulfobacteriota bacterium]